MARKKDKTRKAISCRQFRLWIRRALRFARDVQAPSEEMMALLDRHAEKCPSCANWYEMEKLKYVLSIGLFKIS